jgi:hypothetical protein
LKIKKFQKAYLYFYFKIFTCFSELLEIKQPKEPKVVVQVVQDIVVHLGEKFGIPIEKVIQIIETC